MKQASLPPFHITKTTRISIDADYQLAEDLEAYAEFYARTHDAKVSPAELVREMARQFIASDTDFQAFRSKPRRKRRDKQQQPNTEATP